MAGEGLKLGRGLEKFWGILGEPLEGSLWNVGSFAPNLDYLPRSLPQYASESSQPSSLYQISFQTSNLFVLKPAVGLVACLTKSMAMRISHRQQV